jgi:hypothetical protein
VSGAKRETFDCTKCTGFMPTCLHRITFVVSDDNTVSAVNVAHPACLGTP